MKALKRAVRWGAYKFVPRAFNILVIFGLVLQPMGTTGIWNIALAQSVEPDAPAVVEEVAPAPEPVKEEKEAAPQVEEIAPVSQETEPTEPVSGTPAEAADTTTFSSEETPVISLETLAPTEDAAPVDSAVVLTEFSPEIPPLPREIWSKDGNTATTNNPVQTGITYVAPQNDQVTVIFTNLPDNPGTFSIEEITLTDEQVASLGALSNKAYDATSSMKNGTFEYQLTLPIPQDTQNVRVKYAEDADDLENAETVQGKDVETHRNSVSVSLDHFTLFVATYGDAAFSVEKSEYMPGDTVYVKGTGLNDEKYYRIALDPPTGSQIFLNTCFNPDSDVTTLTDSYILPLDAVSGSWAAELKEYSTTNCTGSHSDVSDAFSIAEPEHVEVTFCHATPPDTAANGYQELTTDDDGVLSGHAPQHSADIIPPFDYYDGHFDGQNWDTIGQAIWENDCAVTGGLKAIKVVDDQSDLTQWSFQLDSDGPIVQVDEDGVADFGPVSAGAHTLTEIGLASYSITNVSGLNCTAVPDTSSATAEVAAGSTTVCTFSNAVDKGSITIIKNATPDDAQDFSFTTTGSGLSNFVLDDDGDNTNGVSNTTTFSNLLPGAYAITEDAVADWGLESIFCDSSDLQIINNTTSNTQEIILSPGETVTCIFTNTRLGTVNVTKYQDDDADGVFDEGEATLSDWDMHLSQGEPFSADETTDDSGQATFADLVSGTYTLSEAEVEGWTLTNISCSNDEQEDGPVIDDDNDHPVSVSAGETVNCAIGNTRVLEPVTVIASKIVCTDEADLPNYGPDPGGPDITADTAEDWVAEHASCELVPDWRFQWSYDGVANPGDNTGEAGSGWNTFGPTGVDGTATVDVTNTSDSSRLWFREIWQSDYIPFAYGATGNADDVSAEFYCNGDVVNYDNWDWADTKAGGTYYCVAWNVLSPGQIIIKKQTDPAGSEQSFDFNPSWSQDTFSLADGEQYESDNLIPGTYSVTELPLTGWRLDSVTCDDQSSPDEISLEPGEIVTCTFKNQETAHIIATKIVCTDESDLPNFGLGGPDMTATTAVDWVETHESCSFQEDWQFQWAYYSDANPGDNTGESLDPVWHTFGPTGVSGQTSTDVDLKSSPLVWVREVWSDDYIPFTYGNDPENVNGDDVSAELYCHNDVQNYDNYDFVDASENAANYYCVAWNVLEAQSTISGMKWNDENSNRQNDDESGIAGWTIDLFRTSFVADRLVIEGTPAETTTTDSAGNYSFNDLDPNLNYIVCEETQSGWEQTSPIIVSDGTVNCANGTVGYSIRSGGEPDTFSLKNFGNWENPNEPTLSIEKSNDSVGDEQPGNSILYTLRVTANDNDVLGVTVTDLPPAGFTYEPGSGTGAPFLHEYASPGVWNVGDMTAGQTVTLTYRATISGSQDDGLYKDLAYATGTSESGGTVVANDPVDADSFVGTQVAVARAETFATVVIPEDDENKIEEKTVKKTKYVLGAATALPMTGASTSTVLLALMMLLSGLILLLLSKRSTWVLMRSLSKSMMKVFFFAILAGSFLVSGQTASAATNLSVQIETPEAVVQSPLFQIGFVALDILGRAVMVECFKESDVLPFASYPLAAGGSSGNCQINAAVMPADGDYVFYVKAVATGEGSETVESNHVNVKLVSTLPGTPYDYDRNDSSCMNNITFTTADDGGKTVKVELYRSLATSFTADASTFVVEQVIGSNVSGSFSTPAPGCSNDYFYALRAVDAAGFGSGFVGDKDVNVDTHTVTKTKTTIVETPGAAATGAIAVTGTGAAASEGAVEGAETTNEEAAPGDAAGEAGSVLGEMTEAVGDAAGGFVDWIQGHPWWSALIALVLLVLGYYGYETYQRKRNEPLQ